MIQLIKNKLHQTWDSNKEQKMESININYMRLKGRINTAKKSEDGPGKVTIYSFKLLIYSQELGLEALQPHFVTWQ